jgi:ferredoxin-NADP reductase
MRDNLIPVIVGRKWPIAEGYHAVEIRAASNAALPPCDEGACVTLCLDNVGDQGRTYPLLAASIPFEGYVFGARHRLASGFELKERDEIFVAPPKRAPTIPGECVRSILFAGGIGAASIAGIAKRLAAAGQRFEFHHFARSADRAVLQDEIDALRTHGKVHRYLDLPDALFEQTCSHALSPARAGTQIYCSGPPAFMDRVARQAREWVYAANIHTIVLGDETMQSKST